MTLLGKYLGLDFEIREIDLLKGEQFSEEFTKLTPVRKLPVLIDGDLKLTESRAILAYLVNTRKPGSDLYPSDVAARALVDERLYYDATVVFKALGGLVVSFSLHRNILKVHLISTFNLLSDLHCSMGYTK